MKMELSINNLINERNSLQISIINEINQIESQLNSNKKDSLVKIIKQLTIKMKNSNFKLSKIRQKYQELVSSSENIDDNIKSEQEKNELQKDLVQLKQKNINLKSQMSILKEYMTTLSSFFANQIQKQKDLEIECKELQEEKIKAFLISQPSDSESKLVNQKIEIKSNNKLIEELQKEILTQEQNIIINNIKLKELEKITRKKNVKGNKKGKKKISLNTMFNNKNINFNNSYSFKSSSFNNKNKNRNYSYNHSFYKKTSPFDIKSLANFGEYKKHELKPVESKPIKKEIPIIKKSIEIKKEEPKKKEIKKEVQKKEVIPIIKQKEEKFGWLEEVETKQENEKNNDEEVIEDINDEKKLVVSQNIEIKTNVNRRRPFGTIEFPK